MLDTAHEAYVSMDSGGFIVDWNRQAEATFGWTRDEVLGRVLADTIVPERYRDGHLKGLEHFLDTGDGPVLNSRLELAGLHRDGHEFPIEITITALDDGPTPHFHAFLHDISERARQRRYLEAQAAITLVLAEAETVDEAVPKLLDVLSTTLGLERPENPRGAPDLVLSVESEPIELFAPDESERDSELTGMLETLASQIERFLTIISERERLREKMEHLALTDELTGLPNRRAWDQGLRRELARAKRQGDQICVALLDLDHFKAFNDDHGHQAGDAVLRQVAESWSARLRAGDLLARYGGEEFALAVAAWSTEAAVQVIERLREATPGGLTCSAGAAGVKPGETPDEVIGRADKALYEAKRGGRDRTVVSP